MRRMITTYDIVATLVPASRTPAIWQAMLDTGATAFRLNTSHLTCPQLEQWLDQLEPFRASANPSPPLVLDLQGSKWRLGDFAAFTLSVDQSIELIFAPETDRPDTLPVPHADFFLAAGNASDEIVLNDAKISLVREASGSGWLRTRVMRGGEISAHKGITFAASDYRQETLSEKDRLIVEETRHIDGVRYAISYVRDVVEMGKYRTHFGAEAYLIAKLERPTSMADAMDIASVSNEMWVCRGDLGAELGLREMAMAVRRFTQSMGDLSVPVLMAGQVLEHMTLQPTSTRSEVCYLYDTLLAGYRGVVLSDEAAIGRYPVASCRAAAMFRTGSAISR